jgi:predicted Zn-dependent protease
MRAITALDRAAGSDLANRAERTTIGGRPAAQATIDVRSDDGRLALDLIAIAHRGRVLLLLGAARPANAVELADVLRSTAASLRAPTAAELARIRETRVRLVRARRGETLEALATRTRSVWRPAMIAVANGLPDATRLAEGQLLKIAVSEPYAAGR